MRGKEIMRLHGQDEAGITPAYAGKSRCILYKQNVIWDHPRVCGEKMTTSVRLFWV